MSVILGLDLGSASIGWAVINYENSADKMKILAMGSRIVPIDGQTANNFNTGKEITINKNRTEKRSTRKRIDRFQARKATLLDYLEELGCSPTNDLIVLPQLDLWQLRAKAVTEKLELAEIGRVLLHISQKRGYNATRAELGSDDKETSEYLTNVRNRYDVLKESGLTIGQFYHNELAKNLDFRIKQRVLPRQAYKEEFDAIFACQSKHYPDLFTDKVVEHLRDYILFYQRPLKSCKHLVSKCEFEKYEINVNGKELVIRPKVAHKSNPLFQLSRIWQTVNSIVLTDKYDKNKTFETEFEHKRRMVEHLNKNATLKASDIYKICLGKAKSDNWTVPENFGKGIDGNKPLAQITKALGKKYAHLAEFNINFVEKANTETGEITKVIDPAIIEQPLYKLWHAIYSISSPEDLENTLKRNFNIDDDEVIENLVKIDFSKWDYGSLSEKAIKKILPYFFDY